MRHLTVIAALIIAFVSAAPFAQAQDQIGCDNFMKNADGSWTALNNTDIPGLGRKLTIRQGSVVRPGATIMSYDIAAMLDQQCPGVMPGAVAPNQPGATAPAATAPAELQKRYGDATGNIDIQTLTCGQLVSGYQEDAEFVLLWSSGWYNGLARRSTLNMPAIKQGIQTLIAYCQANKDKRLTEAIDAVAKGARR